ncbi:exosome complex exonuclease Rrp41 [Methanimicrococcus blatticola]|uniref:Exosome complex component Rrp41 n=1 Tax=Methanimicrococcus blatticola TaxID=91560 RepID=A0A484F5M4_9EURY|nr:exosome complex exonuclease Rrp41 [Methanimicrococcus blatticola]MBZ3935000.1 exosome complex exonuclease Rrp41 [Methanimicrococcus blatticola]MCC2508902.1 exosome complex exonuclease Rrp41 [Methanimicrococcus blatticola]TDQ71070.1 ribosomal RNA-processing protein RRP41/SKI6 [Methanimicrococcus blatticola]
MSSNQTDVVFFDENGLRTDQRKPDEIRPMKIKIGVLSRANGSCYLEWGANKVIAAVYGPREAHPRRMQLANKAVIRYRYNMQSFSVEDRARPGPSRRSSEISKVSREAFEPVLFAEDYPKAAIDIFVEVLQADAGTRTAAINAASLALVDAGIPMRGLVSACAAGKVGGKIVLDLNKPEDNYGEADLPIAMTEDGKITLIQMDGHLTPSEFEEAMELVQKGCRQVLEIQKAALLEKFASVMDDDEEEIIVEEEIEDDAEADVEISVESEDADEADFDEDDIDAFVAEVSERLAKDVSAIIRNYEAEKCETDIDLADGLFEDEDLDIVIIEDDEMDADDLKEIEAFVSDMADDDEESDDDDDDSDDDEETDIFVIDAEDSDEEESDEEFDDDEEEE